MNKLYTREGEHLTGVPWDVYPRPQLMRDSFYNLNGEWEFAVTGGVEPTAYDRTIRVPFPPESMLSGIDEVFPEDRVRWYRRTFTLPSDFVQGRVLLHFGAVDQIAAVFVNGVPMGEHIGGYDAFSLDITAQLQATNTLCVRVEDRVSTGVLPYGKQTPKRGGMWYTPISGIWQTVWLESVPETYIRGLQIRPDLHGATVIADGVDTGRVVVRLPEGSVAADLQNGRARVDIPKPRLWSPEDPSLYPITVTAGADTVRSYLALRTLEIRTVEGKARLCLNGEPYFFHGLLDQGYWSDGLLTPATPEQYSADILAMKSLGFNMLRKHIKVEPELFYYECDRLGMVVFQDMVNNGDYAYLRDTVLPTIGLIRKDDCRLHPDAATRAAFVVGMERTVRQLYNHPSICYWTIFNEGWGQFDSSAMYRLLRELDDSRFIDSTSGWFLGGETDVESRHIYFSKLKVTPSEKPFVLSEFGGYSWKPEGHVFNSEQTYGYGKFESREAFVAALQALYTDKIRPMIAEGLCAAVYTQVSDVEDETNGLLSYDRRVMKITPEEFADISATLTI